MIIIARLSFWIHNPFYKSFEEALEPFKKGGYIEKLKTQITPESMPSNKKDLLEFLYNLIIHIWWYVFWF